MIICKDKHEAQAKAFDLSNRDRDMFYYVMYNSSGQYFVTDIGIVQHTQYVVESWHQTRVTDLRKWL